MKLRQYPFYGFASTIVILAGQALASAEQSQVDSAFRFGGLTWHEDYGDAVATAQQQQRMLLIVFEDADDSTILQQAMDSPEVQRKLSRYVLARLSTDTRIVTGGRKTKVLSHAAFGHMRGSPGVAIVDYTGKNDETYGKVISQFPTSSIALDTSKMSVILDLPVATLTQRTLTFAVRIHPESPRSAWGNFSSMLAEDAEQHSQLMANLRLQGHHNWGQRFQTITSRLPDGLMAQEVAAESWPGEDLVEGAIECVDSWRQSPGHWSAVRRAQPVFGYDMKRGSNGVWYATGLFGNRSQ